MGSDFVHLHTHSEYSVLDSTCKIPALVHRAEECGMEALALTDHGSMGGAIRFYREAKRKKIRPIIGCELYLAPGSRKERSAQDGQRFFHLVVLAMNATGYHNLLALATRAHVEGFYYRPRVDKELLRSHHEGLIALSACQSGEIPRLLLAGREDDATRAAEEYAGIFEDRFYLEVQNHGTERDQRLLTGIRGLAEKLRLPLVATNDIHYLARDDAQAHEVLLNIRANKRLSDPDRRYFEGDGYHFCSAREMVERFGDLPGAIENTAIIAERCDLDLELGTPLLPPFDLPEDEQDADVYLRKLTQSGAEQLFGTVPPEVQERIDYELGVIAQMKYSTYFLIVWDFVRFAREHALPGGPGRGSAAGSMVAYCLGVTSVDPLRYNVTFERFLNPDRVSMPDVDIDFCIRGRDQVIDYVRTKYGGSGWETCTAQIATFDRMAARSVVRDVGRVLGVPYAATDRVAKLIPQGLNLRSAVERVPELRTLHQNDAEIRRVVDIGLRLEGLARNCSTHAAGVVISPDALVRHAPLMRLTDGELVTQFDMIDLETVGLLKFDFLGLRNLTLIDETCRAVERDGGPALAPREIPLDDTATFASICAGRTAGIFQLESTGMTALIRRVCPNRFEDLIALLALYRPGPLDSGMTEEYVQRRTEQAEVRYPHQSLVPILKETYGLPIYQDQQMLIAQRMAGFTLGEADILRKAMGKKDKKIMEGLRARFLEGCTRSGVQKDAASQLFEDMEKFSRYGFTKSHTTAYAFITYWTAYLKANHPTQFMASLLSSVQSDTDKVAEYIAECRAMAISVLPPDINESARDFAAVLEGTVRFGLAAVKHTSETAVEAVLAARAERPYESLFDLCRRTARGGVDRESLEALIKAGAFDSLGLPRRGLLLRLSDAMELMQLARHQELSGQRSFFDDAAVRIADPPVPAERFGKRERLAFEKELLGLYVSSHPLDDYKDTLSEHCTPLGELATLPRGHRTTIGGRIKAVRQVITRKGDAMAFVTLEDRESEAEVTVFSEVAERSAPLLKEDELVALVILVDERRGEPNYVVQQALPLGSANAGTLEASGIILEPEDTRPGPLLALRRLIVAHPGATPLTLRVRCNGHAIHIQAGDRFRVTHTTEFAEGIRELLGDGRLIVQRRPC
ncbi:MAG: DNA polymerase III subunit alpha [Candidatus Bipolaricaulota bacterium]|nr:MAG: DNA polymerase III subunit alpha [Candidatus Bipolaricaulota bacterium]